MATNRDQCHQCSGLPKPQANTAISWLPTRACNGIIETGVKQSLLPRKSNPHAATKTQFASMPANTHVGSLVSTVRSLLSASAEFGSYRPASHQQRHAVRAILTLVNYFN